MIRNFKLTHRPLLLFSQNFMDTMLPLEETEEGGRQVGYLRLYSNQRAHELTEIGRSTMPHQHWLIQMEKLSLHEVVDTSVIEGGN